MEGSRIVVFALGLSVLGMVVPLGTVTPTETAEAEMCPSPDPLHGLGIHIEQGSGFAVTSSHGEWLDCQKNRCDVNAPDPYDPTGDPAVVCTL